MEKIYYLETIAGTMLIISFAGTVFTFLNKIGEKQ